VIKRPIEDVSYSTIFVRIMGSSYPAQEGRERDEGYTVEVYVTEKGYIGTFMVNVVREMVEFLA
jgi:hypothetical protein